MYIFKNALKAVTRNKGRNILIGIIIVLIAISCTVSLAISNSASKLIASYKEANQITASITFDRQSMMKNLSSSDKDSVKQEFSSISSLTKSEIEKYAKSSYVSSYYYTVSTNVNGSNLTKASSTDTNSDKHGPEQQQSSGDFSLNGFSSYDAMSDFISGKYKITSGKIDSSNDYNCIVNTELAKLNNLSVGSKITLVDPNDTTKTYEFTVTGIYTEANSTDTNMFSNSSNTIITSSNAVLAMNTSDSNLKVNINPTFVLKDEASIKKFTKEVKSKGLDSHYTVTTNLDSIDESLTSISNLQTFANTFLIITFILGAVVLFVINHINLRERKYEIGVLRTIGMKKSKVCMQFMAELFIVAFVSLILGTGIGTAISSPVSNTLLKNEISSSQQSANTVRQNFGQGTNQGGPDSFDKSISSTKKVESLKTTVSPKVLAELFAIGIALTLISSASAIIAINRFSPLTILKERS